DIIMGFPQPYVLLSRSDALETRLNSVALGAIYAQRFSEEQTKPRRAPGPARTRTYRVVAVNPGSTSTKIALFENEDCVRHLESEYMIPAAGTIEERRNQADELAQRVLQLLHAASWQSVDAIAARGGFVPRPPEKLSGGAYVIAELQDGDVVVNESLMFAVLEHPEKQHASNLGIPVAAVLARALTAPAYFVDPVVVDEFLPEAEISGYNGIVRRNISHALSIRAGIRKAAEIMGRPVKDVHLVVAHLGGGVSVTAVRNGRMVDSNIALLGGGPFTPQRAGQLPTAELIDLCFSGRFTREELLEELTTRGGLQSYLGEYRLDVIEDQIRAGNEYARLIVDAMTYQIAKEIGAMFAAAGCDIEAIVLTGGMIRSERIRNELRRRVGKLAPILIFDQPLEMEALAAGALGALTAGSPPHRYLWEQPNHAAEGGTRHD
ncbi:MAG TPA: butyrate kinase, partial [Candidatus Hydrogenedentes bacterium]|nr:butyrate kinase [Candidatus Hydrogenedentota bacterium]